jgi:hypothetical protein
MGKIDDMRRQREEQFAAAEKRANLSASKPKATPAAAGATATAAAAPAIARRSKAQAGDDTGKCVGCGKVKALQNGLIAPHQKGFGKACPGSRKEPE